MNDEEGFAINDLKSEGLKPKENFFIKNKKILLIGGLILI